MTNVSNLDERRRLALDQVKESERHVKFFFVGIALWELILLVLIVAFMDFGDRLHLLIFLSAAIVYGTLGIGLVTLGAYTRQNTLRILAALELLSESRQG
ncbi:MAG: hypothetical protein K0U98_24225 [Deltaproteobacteria bacterium]|nr:hypothetical protein [Deltaproteobacteria bacterium]